MSDEPERMTIEQVEGRARLTAARALQLSYLAHLTLMDTFHSMFGGTDMEVDELLSAQTLIKVKSETNAGLFTSLGASPTKEWPMLTVFLVPMKVPDDPELDQFEQLPTSHS